MDENVKSISPAEDVDRYSKEWWIEKIKAWKESGLTAKEWCEKEQICSYDQFIHNRRKYCPEEMTSQREKTFSVAAWSAIEIDTTPAHFEIVCKDVKVTVEKGFDKELLKELLEVIRYED